MFTNCLRNYMLLMNLFQLTIGTSVFDLKRLQDTDIYAREKGAYICSGPKWTEPCIHVLPSGDECRRIPFIDSLQVSFGPDKGVVCTVLEQCDDDQNTPLVLRYPGNAELDVHLVTYYSWYKCTLG